MTDNNQGALEIGRHVMAIMERLEQEPVAVAAFLNGDGSLLITRAGVTFLEFEDRPRFHAHPMPGAPGLGAYFNDVRTQLDGFFRMVEDKPSFREQWMSGELQLIVTPQGFDVVRANQ